MQGARPDENEAQHHRGAMGIPVGPESLILPVLSRENDPAFLPPRAPFVLSLMLTSFAGNRFRVPLCPSGPGET